MKQKLRGGRPRGSKFGSSLLTRLFTLSSRFLRDNAVGGCDEQIRTPSDAFYPRNEQHSTCSETTKLRAAGLKAPRL